MRDSVYRERKHEELGRELEKKEMAVPDFEADAPTPERSLENYHLLPSARRSPRKAEPPRRSPRGVRARGVANPQRTRAQAAPRARPRVRGQLNALLATVTKAACLCPQNEN